MHHVYHHTVQPVTQSGRDQGQEGGLAWPGVHHGPGQAIPILLGIEEYWRLVGQKRNLVSALSMPGLADIELDAPRSRELPRPADVE